MALGLALAVLVSLGYAEPWHLLLASFVNGVILAINNATRQTLVPHFVEREMLGNAIGIMSAGQNVTRILGPSLGGPAIALLGAAGALYLQSAFLLASLVSTLLLPPVRPRAGKALALRRSLADGLSVIWHSPELLGLMVLATIPSLLLFPYIQFLPVYARDILQIGASGLGLLLSAGGAGAVTGALLVAGAQLLPNKGKIILAGTALYTVVIFGFALSQWVPLSVPLLFCGGVLGSFYMGLNNTLLHLNVTDELRGRVMGVYTLTSGLGTLGALPMGFVGSRIGVPHAIAGGALLTLLITIFAAARMRALREL
jgi:predicted MFS family arabinose efflux permease